MAGAKVPRSWLAGCRWGVQPCCRRVKLWSVVRSLAGSDCRFGFPLWRQQGVCVFVLESPRSAFEVKQCLLPAQGRPQHRGGSEAAGKVLGQRRGSAPCVEPPLPGEPRLGPRAVRAHPCNPGRGPGESAASLTSLPEAGSWQSCLAPLPRAPLAACWDSTGQHQGLEQPC